MPNQEDDVHPLEEMSPEENKVLAQEQTLKEKSPNRAKKRLGQCEIIVRELEPLDYTKLL